MSIRFQTEILKSHGRHYIPSPHVNIYNNGWGFDNLPIDGTDVYDYETFDELPIEKRYALILVGSARMLGLNVIEEMKAIMNDPEKLQELWQYMVNDAVVINGTRDEALQWENPTIWMEDEIIVDEKAELEKRIKLDASDEYSRVNPKTRFSYFLEFKHAVVDIIKSTGIKKAVPTYKGSDYKTYGYMVKVNNDRQINIYMSPPRRRDEEISPERMMADMKTITDALLVDYPELDANEEAGYIWLSMEHRYPRVVEENV